jgi:hypothetical protein
VRFDNLGFGWLCVCAWVSPWGRSDASPVLVVGKQSEFRTTSVPGTERDEFDRATSDDPMESLILAQDERWRRA